MNVLEFTCAQNSADTLEVRDDLASGVPGIMIEATCYDSSDPDELKVSTTHTYLIKDDARKLFAWLGVYLHKFQN